MCLLVLHDSFLILLSWFFLSSIAKCQACNTTCIMISDLKKKLVIKKLKWKITYFVDFKFDKELIPTIFDSFPVLSFDDFIELSSKELFSLFVLFCTICCTIDKSVQDNLSCKWRFRSVATGMFWVWNDNSHFVFAGLIFCWYITAIRKILCRWCIMHKN